MTPTSRIKFDPTSKDIILITYPPGGFGNFVYHLLTEFAAETVKSNNNSFKFGAGGNSHNTKKYTVTYYHDPTFYFPYIDSDVDTKNKKILVLIDNAYYDNEYVRLRTFFPNASIVRMCLTVDIDYIVAALLASKTQGLPVELNRDRPFGQIWGFEPMEQENIVNVPIKEFMLDPETTFKQLLDDLGLTLINETSLVSLLANWRSVHKPYFIELYKEFHKEHLL